MWWQILTHISLSFKSETLCKWADSLSPGSMHKTECSGLVHWDDPEGWDGEARGGGVQDGEHMYTHGWFMSMYGKNHYNILK